MLVLGIALLPFTLHLLQIAGQYTGVVRLVNLSVFGLVCALFVPTTVLYSLANLPVPIASRISHLAPPRVLMDLKATYYVLFIFAAAVGAVFILFALMKAAGDHSLATKVKAWALFTMCTIFVGNVVTAIEIVGWSLPQRQLSDTETIVFLALSNTIFAASFVGMLLTTSRTDREPYDPTDDATYDPNDPSVKRASEHQPFTYAHGNSSLSIDPRTPSPMYSRYSYPASDSSPKMSTEWRRSRNRLSTIHSVEIGSTPTIEEIPESEESTESSFDSHISEVLKRLS